jgi:hypothetical protein
LYKVGESIIITFFFLLAYLYWVMIHAMNMRWLANPNQRHSHFFHNFGSWYEHLIHCQSEYSHVP